MLKCRPQDRQQTQGDRSATGAGRTLEGLRRLQALLPNPLQLQQEYGHLEPNCRVRPRQLHERAQTRKRRNRDAEGKGEGVINKCRSGVGVWGLGIWGLGLGFGVRGLRVEF